MGFSLLNSDKEIINDFSHAPGRTNGCIYILTILDNKVGNIKNKNTGI